VRGRPGVLITGRRPGELPGRGVRCLAVERGESGQEKHDKERRRGCASMLGYSVLGSWRDWRVGGGRYLLVGSRPWTHATCSRKGRVMRVDQDDVCSDVGRLGWPGKVAGVVPCCLAWSKPT
jgi:hypothetical protein